MADTPRIENRKARQYYEFLEFFEAGIVLTGPEVKSLRAGQVSFGDSYVECRGGEAYVLGMRIAPYDRGGYAAQDPDRDKKLLLHRQKQLKMLKKQLQLQRLIKNQQMLMYLVTMLTLLTNWQSMIHTS